MDGRREKVVCHLHIGSVGITHTPGGARPPIDLLPPKGVKFEHLGGANKSRNKCILSARRRSASEDYLFRALQIYSFYYYYCCYYYLLFFLNLNDT